ncbi:MAG: hypothetical protein PHC29_08405 [Candidatus Omnitrophica bacterium]|nr:hypothetical protein [Candidatus Omnitrophota bacterium]
MPDKNDNMGGVKIEGDPKELEKNAEAGGTDNNGEGKQTKTLDDVLGVLEGIGSSINNLGERVGKIETGFTEKADEQTDEVKTEEEKKPEGWKPKTWDDIPAVAEEKAKKVYEEEEARKQKEIEEFEKKKKEIDAEYEKQLEEAEKESLIPKIENMENPDDPGRKARREIVGMAIKSKTFDLKSMSEIWKNLADQGIHFDLKTGKYLKTARTNDGRNVPVGSSSSHTPVGSGSKTDYKEIHAAKSLHDLVDTY